jgi:hypothetical protein
MLMSHLKQTGSEAMIHARIHDIGTRASSRWHDTYQVLQSVNHFILDKCTIL